MSQEPPESPTGPPQEPAAPQVPAGPPQVPAGPQQGPAGSPGRAGRWRRATATAGGRRRVGLAAGVLAVLLLVAAGLTGAAVQRHDDQGARSAATASQGKGARAGARAGRGGTTTPTRAGRGAGTGGLAAVLGSALHGEVTTDTGGTTGVMLFQRGQVTAVTTATITLRSTDGFTGSYQLGAGTRHRAGTLAAGDQALVVAQKSDRVVTTLARLTPRTATPSSTG